MSQIFKDKTFNAKLENIFKTDNLNFEHVHGLNQKNYDKSKNSN
jgi:predicted aldo/keto reductase-like oxidoreductase